MPTPKQPRQKKTPKQRAEEALGIAERKVANLTRDFRRLQKQLNETSLARDEAIKLCDYAKAHPALQTSTSTTNQEAGPA